MTDVAISRTELQDSAEAAGEALGRSILDQLDGKTPDAVVLFASPVYSPTSLLRGLDVSCCSPKAVIGASSAGEFTSEEISRSSAVALALRSDDLRFKVHVARDVQAGVERSAANFAESFDPNGDPEFPHRTVLLLMDVLAGYGEQFLESFTETTSGRYQVFGGGAADDAAFEETFVFAGQEAIADAAVGLEICSKQPVGIGVSHGWTPFSHTMTATSSSGLKLAELDGRPAADVIESFAQEEGVVFDRDEPLSFFLHHVLGIETNGDYKLRVPLEVEEDGSVLCAAEVPAGAKVRVMRTRNFSAADAARVAVRRAQMKLKKAKVEPGVALFFDCASTRLRLGDEFGSSVDEIVDSLGSTAVCIGCNTYGQFARVEGQFSGFHNCTAVVGVLPR